VSDPIAVPQTGRLSVAVWLRVADETQQPPLRLGIQGQWSGHLYTRSGAIGQASGGQRLQADWAEYVFQVQDCRPKA